MLERVVVGSLVMIDDYYPPLMSVLFGGVSHKNAALAAEKKFETTEEKVTRMIVEQLGVHPE
jgi:hypothetical protein